VNPLTHVVVTFLSCLLAGFVLRWLHSLAPLGPNYSGRLVERYSDRLTARAFAGGAPGGIP